MGDKKWVGIVIPTDEASCANITWNGSALSAADDADAISIGESAGSVILWIDAEATQYIAGRKIILGTVDGSKDDVEITVKVQDI